VIGEANRRSQKWGLSAGQIDDHMVELLAVVEHMLLQCGYRNIGDDRKVNAVIGIIAPLREPALRVGVDHADAQAPPGKLRCQEKNCGCLACTALGVCERDDCHDEPERKKREAAIIAQETAPISWCGSIIQQYG
jgi:hypothetical protein